MQGDVRAGQLHSDVNLHARGHQSRMSQHLPCKHSTNCQEQNYMRNYFSANGASLSPAKENGKRGSHCKHKEKHLWIFTCTLMLHLCVFRLPNGTRALLHFYFPSAFCPSSSSSRLREWGHFVRLRVQTLHFLKAVTRSHLHPYVR